MVTRFDPAAGAVDNQFGHLLRVSNSEKSVGERPIRLAGARAIGRWRDHIVVDRNLNP